MTLCNLADHLQFRNKPTINSNDLPLVFLITVALLLAGCSGAFGPHRVYAAEEVLVVNSDSTDPGVPLDLSLTIRLFPKERLLEITARIEKHAAFPAALFSDKNVKVEIKLPVGLQLQEGSLTWEGDLQGDERKQFQAKIKAIKDTEGTVFASAIGYAVGGRVDADTEQFYVSVKGNSIRQSLEPFSSSQPLKPGPGAPGR